MAGTPSSAIAGAAVAALALADILAHLARTLPLPSARAQAALGLARRAAVIDAPRFVTPDDVAALAGRLVDGVQAMARDALPADAAQSLYAAARASQACAPLSHSPVLMQAYGLARALCAGIEATCLGEAFLCEARSAFTDRQAATAARARIAAAMDASSDRIAAALGPDAIALLATAARQTSAQLVAQAATLAPIARVRTPRSLPSTALAWALYRDPARAVDLVARNRCGTSLFLPTTIEALTPDPA